LQAGKALSRGLYLQLEVIFHS